MTGLRPGAGPATPRPDAARTSALAGLAVVLTATALAGVLSGLAWLADVLVAALVVAGTGALLRMLRIPAVLVALGQLAALTGLVTVMFTDRAVLAVLPGPEALHELETLLRGAAEQIRVGIAPVPATRELRCLMVIALGLVTVLVDTVAVSAAAPAASGLMLLAVLAVPALLADELLPWWSFAAGALGFALLLSGRAPARPAPLARIAGPVAGLAVAVALLVGVTVTAVGTVGPLPGTTDPDAGSGVGLDPFTSLRGQLTRDEPVTLFRVRGMEQASYLRALTLSRFENDRGWFPGPMADPAAADRAVPLPPAARAAAGRRVSVRIEPINYRDTWLPTVGVPLGFRGLPPGASYDPETMTAFADSPTRAGPYTVRAVLPAPAPATSREDPDAALPPGLRARYLDTGGLDPRVARLAERVTAGAGSAFDAAVTLTRFFTDPANGFRYSLQTARGSTGDALVDFLFQGRTGYCEQYASAMAIMLRALGIPARVAIGFTAGADVGPARLITTRDAHAWVEAWFPGAGWLPFDPTPVAGARGSVPPRLPAVPPPTRASTAPPSTVATPQPQLSDAAGPPATPAQSHEDPGFVPFGTALLVLLGTTVGLGPLAVRSAQRRSRVRTASGLGAGAATAAWTEVLAEAADRGTAIPATQTARDGADRLAAEHGFDERARAHLNALVEAVERSWYGTGGHRDPQLPAALAGVRAGWHRCAPPSLRIRLLPGSVLPQSVRQGRR